MICNDTIAEWFEQVQLMDMRQPSEWEAVDAELFTAQYSYIKLGLLLTKIRNTSSWKYCAGKFESFKNWCTARVHLAVWQANQYIEAAEIAMYLAGTGAEILPKNLSQCLALRKAYHAEETYYGERPQLDAAWANVTEHYQGHQITAGKIHAIVDPDWQENQPSKIDKTIVDRAVQNAAKKGMTLNEYLEDLIGQDEYDPESVSSTPHPIDPELAQAVDALDRQFQKQPDRTVTTTQKRTQALNMFDNLMNDLVGQFIPPVNRTSKSKPKPA
jgi:hypothetical protein